MPVISLPRWLTKTKPQIDSEDTHELLSEHELPDQPIARWAQTRNHGAFNYSLRNSRAKKLYVVLALGLFTAVLIFHKSGTVMPPPSEEEEPAPPSQWPWQDFAR